MARRAERIVAFVVQVGSTQWKERVVHITTTRFVCYEPNDSANALYSIPLQDVTTLNPLPPSMAVHAFQLSTKKKNFTYRTQNARERDDWVDALTKCTNVGSMLQKHADSKLDEVISSVRR